MSKKSSKTVVSYSVDCLKPVDDEIFDLTGFETFLKERLKYEGKAGVALSGNSVYTVSSDIGNATVRVDSTVDLSKRYIKYLTKKYLKAEGLRDYITVIANSKSSYELRYFDVQEEDEA